MERLSAKVVRRAQENAHLNQEERVIVWRRGRFFDLPASADPSGKVVARVSWDGEVTKVKEGK